MKRLVILSAILLATTAVAETNEPKQIGTIEQGKASYKKKLEWMKEHPDTPPPLTPEEEKAIFGDGAPRPGSGVHVMPASKMHYSQHQMENIRVAASLLKRKGYVEKYNQSATNLLMFRETANADYAQNNPLGDRSSHLRHTLADLKMAYDYRGVPHALVKEVIGFAPENTFIQPGWSGAVEFFTPQQLEGVCSYHEVNIELTGSAANFAEELVSYQINNKVSIVEVSGNEASGYAYNIEWWDPNFRHRLECASKVFKPEVKQQVIALAVAIDNEK